MDHIDAVSSILTALGPVATGVLGFLMRRSDRAKLDKLEQITHQVGPNNGASLRDAVDRIETTLTEVAGTVVENTARIEAIEVDRKLWLARIEAAPPQIRRRWSTW